MTELMNNAAIVFVVAGVAVSFCVAITVFIVKGALKDIQEIKGSQVSKDSIDELKTDLKGLSQKVDHAYMHNDDRYLSRREGKILEAQLQLVQTQISSLDGKMISHIQEATKDLKKDFTDKMDLLTKLIEANKPKD